jgi:hypothetical protein
MLTYKPEINAVMGLAEAFYAKNEKSQHVILLKTLELYYRVEKILENTCKPLLTIACFQVSKKQLTNRV